MAQILISFERQNVILPDGAELFGRRQPMRFEFVALLAFRRAIASGDQAWVSLADVGRLPGWKGRRGHHIATNIGRYLQFAPLKRLVDTKAPWGGPYRLSLDSLLVAFDISLSEVRRHLSLRRSSETRNAQNAVLDFACSYARAQWLFFRGKLLRGRGRDEMNDDAYGRLMQMSGDRKYNPTLRLLASVSAVDVLYRLGRFRSARQSLCDSVGLVRRAADLSLKARFYLSLAWAYQRAATGNQSDRLVERALAKAGKYAENSGDRAALGLLAYRKGGYFTKKRRHPDAIASLIDAVEAYLITGNFHGVQAACGEVGSVIHRLDSDYYPEARRWLLSSVGIARLMGIGRDDAHAEMILGKIYVETDRPLLARLMLQRAERIANKAGNKINLADIKMVRAFWYQRYGTRKEQTATLVAAVQIFRSMAEFDVPQKEDYMRSKFPEVWPDVLKAV